MLEKLLKVLSRIFAAENVTFDKKNQAYRVDSVNIGDGRRVCTTRLNGNIRIFKVEPPYDSEIIFITISENDIRKWILLIFRKGICFNHEQKKLG